MDSFYPKFGEVELVLVEDDNDFYDPLETNFEFEDENEDIKLQLNDTIHDENPFQLSVDADVDDSLPEYVDDFDGSASQEVPEETCKPDIVTLKTERASDDDSLDGGDAFQDNEIENDDLIDVKPNIQEIKELNNGVTQNGNNKTPKEDEKNSKEHSKPIDQFKQSNIQKQTSKIQSTKTKSAAGRKTKTRQCKKKESKIEETIDIKKPKEEQEEVANDSEKKSTRQYSKRNEIPKQSQHNEAYDKKLLFCKIFSIQFERSPAFTEHMRDEHSIDKPFECFICSKTYRISSLLAEHIRYHFGEKPYKCKFCERSFSQLQPYKAHVRKSHTLERPYKCNFIDENDVKCGESFFDTKTYKFHLREHTNEQPFTCEFCSKKFNHSGTYQAHMRIHTNERPYQCVICGKSFAQISTHKAHMLTHSDEFKFPCTECDKKFKQATNLKLHMRVHTKETPYKCEDCGRGFAQLVTYRNHRRIHTGEKPFECTYEGCGKSFRHRNSFRRHLQTHTGEKPFQCKVCFKRLSQTSSYISHMRRHEKPEKS